jgi:hypothetical protein
MLTRRYDMGEKREKRRLEEKDLLKTFNEWKTELYQHTPAETIVICKKTNDFHL